MHVVGRLKFWLWSPKVPPLALIWHRLKSTCIGTSSDKMPVNDVHQYPQSKPSWDMPKQILKKSSLPEIRRKNALKNPFFVLFGGCRWPVGGDDGRGWKNVVENFVQIREGEILDILETVDLDIFQDGQDCFFNIQALRASLQVRRFARMQLMMCWCFQVFHQTQFSKWNPGFCSFLLKTSSPKKEKTDFSSENRLFSPATAPARIKTFKNTKYLQILGGNTRHTRYVLCVSNLINLCYINALVKVWLNEGRSVQKLAGLLG